MVRSTKSSVIQIKRAYETPSRADGIRILVDRLWPRGVSKEAAKVERWVKEIAPSNALRKWFGHDPERWTEFKKRYERELKSQKGALAELIDLAKGKTVTLVYAAKDEEHNNAVVLRDVLMNRLSG